MRFAIRLAVGLLALSALVVPAASSASAAASQRIVFCNNGTGFTYQAIFPQSGNFSTNIIQRNQCQSYTRSNPNEPFIIRVRQASTGAYRDYAGYLVRCYANRNFTVAGTYQATLTPTLCA